MTTLSEDPRFAAALEDCCERARRAEPLEECVVGYPEEYREELARLVPLARRAAQLRQEPTTAFVARLEQRLLASVDEARRSGRSGLLGRLGGFFSAVPAVRAVAVALAVAIVVIGSGVGVVQASDSSLPDSPLYQVKTAREWVELALARDAEARLAVDARQIAERGRELDRAVKAGKPRLVVQALSARLIASTDRMVDEALRLRKRGVSQPAERALTALQSAVAYLERLTTQAPLTLRPTLRALRTSLEQQIRRLERG